MSDTNCDREHGGEYAVRDEAAGAHWCEEYVGPGRRIAVYHASDRHCRERTAKRASHSESGDAHQLPALFVTVLVIVIFAIGLYLYAQATECRMARSLRSTGASKMNISANTQSGTECCAA